MRNPPGVSAADFSAALGKFANIIGNDWVFTSDADLALYRDPYSPLRDEPDERVASAAVAPDTVEKVQAIVRVANQYRIPLYTISTGRNLTYGGPAPIYSGSVVLDLKRMNRIIEVSERGAYCVVEPGVSYFDFYTHIREHKLKLRMDPPGPGWGSLIGNALEHGVGRQVYRDHFASHCGMEVVLANGELLRTGMGGLPTGGSLWPRFKYGYGPYIDGLFAQSNFGIVTKMGLRLLPEPEESLLFDASISNFEDLEAFVDELSYLHDSGILNCNSELVTPLLSTRIPESKALLESPGGGSSRQWNDLSERLNTPPWGLQMANIMGPKKIVQAHFDYLVERFSRFKGFKVTNRRSYSAGVDPSQVQEFDLDCIGIPNLGVFTGVGMSRGHGHMDFSPVFPMTGEAVRKINALRQQGYREAGVPWAGWRGGNCWFNKAFVMIDGFQLTADPAHNKKLVAAFQHLITLLGANGFTEYRTHAIYEDLLMSQFSFNDHQLLRFHEAVKDAVDPAGILAAGRAGIWPKYLRRKKA
jgi:4-cresol dehydrogenase (hydroxylating)